MLTKILSRSECAECKECCVFSRYDVWEQPALIPEVKRKAEQLLPETKFLTKGVEACIFRIEETDSYDLFLCPLLDVERGCLLGTEKPFECQIYPFQVAEIADRQAIIISPLCEVIMKKPIGILLDFLKEELAEKIFRYAEQHPDVVRPYDNMSPVLLWKPETL